MAGLLDAGSSFRQGALSGLTTAAESEQARDEANDALDSAQLSRFSNAATKGDWGSYFIGEMF